MKVFHPPKAFVAPTIAQFMKNGKFDADGHDKAEKAYIEAVQAACREHSNCPDAGELVWWPVADGSATYVVYNYRELWHLPTSGNYALDEAHERGLRKADIVQKIKQIKIGPPPIKLC